MGAPAPDTRTPPTAPPTAPPGTSAGPGTPSAPPRAGIAGLPFGQQIVAALALALIAVAAGTHLAIVFLHVAPSNTLTKQHSEVIDKWVYPEFEQNWKLFAPNPLQQNVAVQVRAQLRGEGGDTFVTGWYDLSALDGEAIDGNLLPSHTQQNELRRAWDFFSNSHDNENRATGLRGALSERYVRRIAVMRLERLRAERPDERDGVIERIQMRSVTTNVPPPPWSGESADRKPTFRQLPWWLVDEDDKPLDAAGDPRAGDGRTEAGSR
ncbi:DUF5819 family protein [Streptomyces uncialis]|uniref:DUF5819 family protein n=1 Tax=Streptomyces uncialis TaxID=1048205 RepID=UPI00381239E0